MKLQLKSHRLLVVLLAVVLMILSIACEGKEGFGFLKKTVAMERVAPPGVILPVKRIALVFNDSTKNASRLRERIEAGIRTGDPQMLIGDDAPYVMTVNVREFLFGNTHSIDGTYRLSDRADRTIDEGNLSASNAGALVSSSDDKLIDEAAADVLRIIVPRRHQTAVLMPKGRLESLISLAESGDWRGYLSAVERMEEQRGEPESYRLYALAVAHEGMGYQSPTLVSTVRHLREAVRLDLAAAHAKPSEQFFSEDYQTLLHPMSSPALPPARWVSPHEMELWESMALIHEWMAAPALPDGTLDNRSVLGLYAAGRPDDAILSEISKAEGVKFSVEKADMIALSKAGVSWDVIDAMRKKAGLGRREFWITPDKW